MKFLQYQSNHIIFLLLGASMPLGCVFGCLIGGAISEKIGKKCVVFFSNLVVMVLWTVLSVANMTWLIILLRLLIGLFSSGAFICIGEFKKSHGHK